jgi:Helix-turn-helix domain of resolvase
VFRCILYYYTLIHYDFHRYAWVLLFKRLFLPNALLIMFTVNVNDMKFNFKKIHIGSLLYHAVKEREIGEVRIRNFFHLEFSEIEKMYDSESIDTEHLLKWCKLLDYDFFRLYSQHLILYSPSINSKTKNVSYEALPQFRKNIYTNEMIEFLLEMVNNGEKTIAEIVQEYGVPRTTIYRWMNKHKSMYR